ncbi:uncharacterized protein ACIBXB_020750 isoform 4-T4 [Morphnus guianensis]
MGPPADEAPLCREPELPCTLPHMDTRVQDGAEALLEGCPTAESEGGVPMDVPEPAGGEVTPWEDKAAAGTEHPRQERCWREPRGHRVPPRSPDLAGEAGRSGHHVPSSTS